MKKIKRIKQRLIKLLGGYTEDKYITNYVSGYDSGFYHGNRATLNKTLNAAKDLYGLPADEWCMEMYNYIEIEYKKSL